MKKFKPFVFFLACLINSPNTYAGLTLQIGKALENSAAFFYQLDQELDQFKVYLKGLREDLKDKTTNRLFCYVKKVKAPRSKSFEVIRDISPRAVKGAAGTPTLSIPLVMLNPSNNIYYGRDGYPVAITTDKVTIKWVTFGMNPTKARKRLEISYIPNWRNKTKTTTTIDLGKKGQEISMQNTGVDNIYLLLEGTYKWVLGCRGI